MFSENYASQIPRKDLCSLFIGYDFCSDLFICGKPPGKACISLNNRIYKLFWCLLCNWLRHLRNKDPDSYPVSIYVCWGWETADWIRGYESILRRAGNHGKRHLFLSVTPRAPQSSVSYPIFSHPEKHINSDWVPIWQRPACELQLNALTLSPWPDRFVNNNSNTLPPHTPSPNIIFTTHFWGGHVTSLN